MTTSSRTLICAVLVLLVVMTLLFMMSFFKFQTTLTTLVQNRLTVVGITIGETIESAVDLGMAVREVRTADALIGRAKRNDPGIERIEIFDIDGTIRFSTEDGRIYGPAPASVVEAQKGSAGRTWGFDTEDAFVSGVSLTNSFGQLIGGVVLSYAKTGFDAQVADLTYSLLRKTIFLFAGFTVLAFIGIRFGFRGLGRYMDGIQASLEKDRGSEPAETASSSGTAGQKPAPTDGDLDEPILGVDDFDAKLAAIEANRAGVLKALDDLEHTAPCGSSQAPTAR
jgi:hypothetical protein